MSPEKEQILYKSFPALYRDPFSKHIECNDGWYQLIYTLSGKIDDIFRASKLSDDDCPKVDQVKEKFGGLRFYVSCISPAIKEDIYAAINVFEAHSFQTCELCGRNGKLRDDRAWMKTLCDEHNKPVESMELAGNIA